MKSLKEKKLKIIEENFFRPKWYSVFINPYFIDRYGLYYFIKKFAEQTPAESKILDVGCGEKPYRKLFKSESYTGIDIQGGGHSDQAKTVDKFYDGVNIPFENNSFNTIICTQVLEHATEPEKLIAQCSDKLKTGGKIFVSMPFTYPEHEIPYDFQRFTSFKHRKIMESSGFKNIKISKTTGFFGTSAQMLSIVIFESLKFRASVLKTLISIVILSPIQIIGVLLDKLFSKRGSTINYVIIAEK